MDVSLHLGAYRTGNTSLKALLSAARPALAANGLAFWGEEERRAGHYRELIRPADTLTEAAAERGQRSVETLRTLMEVLEDDGVERLIVSEPHMMGSLPEMLKRERLYPFLRERLGRFAPVFHDRCDRVLVIIRAYDTYWRSAAAQAVADGHPLLDRRARTRLAVQPVRWRRVIETIGQILPRAHLIVVPFEALAGHWDAQMTVLAGEAGRAALRDASGAAAPEASAPSGDGAGRDRLARGPEAADLRTMLAERGAPADDPGLAGQGPWCPFDEEEVADLCHAYAEDLAWLRKGASGLATFIESADAQELREMDRTRGRPHHDRHHRPPPDGGRLGEAG